MINIKPYQDKEQLTKLLNEHRSYKATARFLGVNEKTVTAWAKKFKLQSVGTQGARRHKVNEHFFDDIDTEEKAYWLGFLMADGCVYHGSDKNSYRLQINLAASDADCLERFNQALSSDYAIRIVDVQDCKTNKVHKAAQLKINCTALCKKLIKHGVVPRKSLICQAPDIALELVPHYIRGYFDGDGCITRDIYRGKWSIKIIGTESTLEFFQAYFDKHEILSAIYDINHSKAKTLEIAGNLSISHFYDYVYDNASVFYKRKYKRFLAFKKCCPASQR